MKLGIALAASALVTTMSLAYVHADTSCMIGETGVLNIFCLPFNISGAAFQAVTGSQAIRVNHQNVNGVIGVNVINGTTRVVASVDHFAYSNQAFDDNFSLLDVDVNFVGTTSSLLQCRTVSYDFDGTLLGQTDIVSRPCNDTQQFFQTFLSQAQAQSDFGFVAVYCDLPINCTITGLNASLISEGD